MTKFVDILLAENANGNIRTFVAPTSTANVGDVVLHDGDLFTVIASAWFDVGDDKYPILEGSTTLYTPDKILAIRWEKKDELEADNDTIPGNS